MQSVDSLNFVAVERTSSEEEADDRIHDPQQTNGIETVVGEVSGQLWARR